MLRLPDAQTEHGLAYLSHYRQKDTMLFPGKSL